MENEEKWIRELIGEERYRELIGKVEGWEEAMTCGTIILDKRCDVCVTCLMLKTSKLHCL